MKKLFFKVAMLLLVDSFTKQSKTLRDKALGYIKYHAGTGFSLIDKTLYEYASTDAFYALPATTVTNMHEYAVLYAITDITVDEFGYVWYVGEAWETGDKIEHGVLSSLSIECLCTIAELIRKGKIIRN